MQGVAWVEETRKKNRISWGNFLEISLRNFDANGRTTSDGCGSDTVD
jgi:hypothetical protein